MGERIGWSLWAGFDLTVFLEGQISVASFTIRGNRQLGFLLAVLTKRASDLAGPIALVFEKIEGQGISGVITLRGFILSFIILSFVILSFVILSFVILSFVILSFVILGFVILGFVILGFVILSFVNLVIPIFFVSTLRNRSDFFGNGGRIADFGFTNKDCAGFDGDRACLDITNHLGTAFDFNSLSARDIAMNFSIDDDGFGRDLGFNMGVFGNGEGAIGADFAFDPPINKEVISKSD